VIRLAAVDKEECESVRRELNARSAVRRDRKIFERDGKVHIPITDSVDECTAEEIGFEIVLGESPPRSHHRAPMERILHEIEIPPDLNHLLPRKWELLGKVLVLRIPRGLRKHLDEVVSVYARVLGAKTVCEEVGTISGTFRTPSLRVLKGDTTATVHRENGILFKMDVARVMFSSGNIDERKRMGDLDCSGETVVDMFAGIGYFTLPLARHAGAERVIGCEINPVAAQYLKENARLNGVEDRVLVFNGDNRNLPMGRVADRVVMGYLGTTHEHLNKAISLLKEGGIIHYHETCGTDQMPDRPVQRITEAAGKRGCEILGVREVKSYAPAVSHVVVDARIPR